MSGERRLIADGKYELLRVIGEGGMGTVYLARHVALDRHVAIKVLSPAAMHRADAPDRFLNEARLVSQLRHQSTVQLLDFGTDGREYWLVMEHLQGKDLASILQHHKSLPLVRALNIVTQLLAALGEAHDLGIVHRDLKPANIMVIPWQDDDGLPTELVKVLDFGIATLAADSKPSTEVSGTPPYMSPEQVQGLGVDARSDIYAVGAILHELLTGAPPFDEADPIATMAAHLERDPPPLRSLSPELPAALEACVLTALAKSPVARFPHARAFRSRLLEIADAHATPIRRPATTDLTVRALTPITAPAVPARAMRSGLLWVVVAAALVASMAALVLVLRGDERDARVALPVDGAMDAGGGVAGVVTAPAGPLQQPATAGDVAVPEMVGPDAVALADIAVEDIAVEDIVVASVDVIAAPEADAGPVAPDNDAVGGVVAAATMPGDVALGPPKTTIPPRGMPPSAAATRVPAVANPATSSVTKVAETSTSAPPEAPTEPATVAPTPEKAPDVPPVTVAVPPKPESPPTQPALAARATITDLDVDGSLPRSSVQRALDGARTALEACYRAGAQKAGRDATASLVVTFAVNIDGQLSDVGVAPFELPGFSACAAAAIGRLRTRDRPDTGTVTGRARLRLAPLPALAAP